MELSSLLGLLQSFAARTPTVRGRRVHDGAIFLSLDSDGSGRLEAKLEPPGRSGEDRLASALRAEPGDGEAFTEFRTTDELIGILGGSREPQWTFIDEV